MSDATQHSSALCGHTRTIVLCVVCMQSACCITAVVSLYAVMCQHQCQHQATPPVTGDPAKLVMAGSRISDYFRFNTFSDGHLSNKVMQECKRQLFTWHLILLFRFKAFYAHQVLPAFFPSFPACFTFLHRSATESS